MRGVLWNTQWARPGTPRGQAIAESISLASPDVVCLTEAYADFPVGDGYPVFADPDYGYADTKGRRKVLLWSRSPWSAVTTFPDNGFPGGRIVSGITQGIRFIGVCVPWSAAHVSTGRRDRRRWEDHAEFLRALALVVEQKKGRPLVILGDINQAIPRSRQPAEVFLLLDEVLSHGIVPYTRGRCDSEGRPMIDHVMTNSLLSCTIVSNIPAKAGRLVCSDHDGLVFDLAR